MSVYDSIREGIAEDWRKAKAYDSLLAENTRLREVLNSIAQTAQAASQHQPEQFCEWAYDAATMALLEGRLP